jgi:hypothetical protein
MFLMDSRIWWAMTAEFFRECGILAVQTGRWMPAFGGRKKSGPVFNEAVSDLTGIVMRSEMCP